MSVELSPLQVHQAFSFIGINSGSVSIDSTNLLVFRSFIEEHFKLLNAYSKKSNLMASLQKALRTAVEKSEISEHKVKTLVKECDMVKSFQKIAYLSRDKTQLQQDLSSNDQQSSKPLLDLISFILSSNYSIDIVQKVQQAICEERYNHVKDIITSIEIPRTNNLGNIHSEEPLIQTLRANNIALAQHVSSIEKELEAARQKTFKLTLDHERNELALKVLHI